MQYRSVTVLAPAKLNLSLDVVGTLPNGYHDLDMVMQTIDLYEKITLRRSNDLSLTLPGSFVPVNDKNSLLDVAEAAKAEAKKPKQTRKTTQKQKKPSIRAQLAAAKEEQKKKPPAREKSKEMEV